MTLIYPKPLRLPVGPNRISSKQYMKKEDMKYLLSGKVAIEEKMDGTAVSHSKDKFTFFAEDMKLRHTIHYRIPARFAVFDVFDNARGVFLAPEEKEQLVRELAGKRNLLPSPFVSGGIFPVRLLEDGAFSVEDLIEYTNLLSKYAFNPELGSFSHMEGVVVKPSRELFFSEHLSGKIVRKEFLEGILVNYLRRRPQQYNMINPSFGLRD